MSDHLFYPSRRLFLGSVAFGLSATFFTVPGAFAEELSKTPRLTEGPFYPDKLPLDKDSDLVIVGDSTTPALGEVTHLTGRVLDVKGEPLKDCEIEIWQVDNKGVYLNTKDSGRKERDKNFQGYGRATTTAKGEYRFRTIKPVPYTGRTPHIHVRVNKGGKELLTTQIFIAGHAQNKNDGVYGGIRDALERELVQADFKPVKDSKIGELSAVFDIVIGKTPSDKPEGRQR